MRIGWLVDYTETPGGAELTQAEFRDAAPDDVEIVDCPPGVIYPDCDRYVIHNCVRYTLEQLRQLEGKPVTKYWHDVGPWLSREVWDWLERHTNYICCSPIQLEMMNHGEGRETQPGRIKEAALIPPSVDLKRFEDAASRMNGNRAGACSIGSWRNYGKAPHKAAEWSAANGPIDFYGGGEWAPHGSREIPYDDMPTLLASYETFVFLPTVLEPFGRLVAEAWAAGCTVVTNNLVGAKWWIENDPDALQDPASRFWQEVLRDAQ